VIKPLQYSNTHYGSDVVARVRSMFPTKSRSTWITVEPLSFPAISALVSKTLHRPKEDCLSLSRFVYTASSGNAFSARNILITLQRQHHVSSLKSSNDTYQLQPT
jgi:hypothetical protein